LIALTLKIGPAGLENNIRDTGRGVREGLTDATLEPMDIDRFFAALWRDYVEITPQAGRIHDLFTSRGETVVNDHVAFRTFSDSPVSLDRLEPLILGLGYRRFAPYEFPDRHLRAFGYLHNDPRQPRIFCSELLVGQLSAHARERIMTWIDQIDRGAGNDPDVFWSGRLWRMPMYEEYLALLKESEYAAWLSVLGLRANHFTVSVNHLRLTPELGQVLDLVKQAGFELNTEGGEIKGSPAVLLEQGSTLADRIEFTFGGGDRHTVPTCYYEFAKRYPDEEGKLYQGFVPASASRLFDSTAAGPAR